MTRRSLSLALLAPAVAACAASAPTSTAPSPPRDAAPAPTVAPKEVGALGQGDCSTKAFLDALGPTCARIKSHNLSGATAAAASEFATDDDACTVWSSGGMPPQEIGLDLEKQGLVS